MTDTPPPAILIIDDTPANRYTFSRILQKGGYAVSEAASPAEGMETLRAAAFDLLILDVQMEGGNGFELCARLKADPLTRGIPILMVSAAFVQGRDKAYGLDSGADGYLTTPFDPLELLATVRSLLRVRAAEEALHDALRQAQDGSAAKSEFLANMSHEIRTPLNAIVGIASLLERGELVEDKKKLLLATLRSSADSLLELINDLLDISKIEQRDFTLIEELFHCHEMFEEVGRILTPRAQEKGIGLSIDDASIRGMGFIGDKARLKQILLNVVGNAVKFTKQGSVRLAVRRDASLFAGGGLVVEVTDTGIGIPREQQGRMFEKFARGGNTGGMVGTGLGLAITRHLLEMMDGTIAVESVEGEGTTVVLRLPDRLVTQGPGAAAMIDISDTSFTCGKHILLIEDFAGNVIVATALLDELGVEYDIAPDGAQGLAMIERNLYDLVLMDVNMPVLDGLSATRRLREAEQRDNRRAVPVIGLTAHALAGDREACLAAGMNDYLAKPVTITRLYEKLKIHLH